MNMQRGPKDKPTKTLGLGLLLKKLIATRFVKQKDHTCWQNGPLKFAAGIVHPWLDLAVVYRF